MVNFLEIVDLILNGLFFQRMFLLSLLDFLFNLDNILWLFFELMEIDSQIIQLILDLLFFDWMLTPLIVSWLKIIFEVIIHYELPHTNFAAPTSWCFVFCVFVDWLQRVSSLSLYAVFAAVQSTELALLQMLEIFFI